jgi:hypothetical protein
LVLWHSACRWTWHPVFWYSISNMATYNKTSKFAFKQKESNITFLSIRLLYVITWFFFLSICTLKRLLPYSAEVACGIFSAIHSFSSSTSRRNWIREKINILVVHRTFHTAHLCSWLLTIYNAKKKFFLALDLPQLQVQFPWSNANQRYAFSI